MHPGNGDSSEADPQASQSHPEWPADGDGIVMASPGQPDAAGDGCGECEIAQSQVTMRVVEAVLEWRVTAVGRRPQDHMARDLLHGSLLRDRRPRLYHRNVKEPPAWVLGAVAHLPTQAQK